ncbi:TonB-dependent receptor [Pseudomonas sp. RL]|uniref:TonB-dependent receptor domain-containing protein n=1 Tax=Pseudomonas sp. RL TaxID=1452718 RepID=UPI0004889C9B|nr:TonB-dependent receptor [Pseudomonas sp. RL]
MSLPFARTALATALLSASAAVFAQDPLVLGDTVVSAAGYEQKITEAPASISVISQEDLRQKQFANLAEALGDVEGVDIGQGTGKTGGLNISIRGMPSDYTLILIDGRRQKAAGNVTPNGFNETGTSFMPPMSAIERIEVIRGPMSTLYGSDAMGGVINIITKKVAKEWGGSITAEHTLQEDGDYGDASKVSLYTNGPLVDGLLGLALRGSFYDREASDLKFNDGSTVSKRGVSPVEGNNANIGARLTLTPHEDHDFALDFDKGRQVYNNDECQLGNLDGWGSGNATTGCATPRPTQANGYQDELRFERQQFALTHTGRFAIGTLDSSLMHNTTETVGRTIPGGTFGRPGFKPIGTSYDNYPSIVVGNDRELETTNLILDTKLVAPIGDSHILTSGAQWWNAEMTDGLASEEFEQTTWSLFTEDEWRLRDNLALTVGARYDHHDAFGGHVSPRAYLVWNTTENWTLKGGVSRGYKTPDLNDLHDGINGVGGQGSTISIGNPDLKPEVSTSTEFGVYYDNLVGFNANATLFHNQFDDKIASGSPVADPLCASNTDGTCTPKINVDEAVTQGLELAASWQFAPRWTLSGNYTYTDSEQKSGENKGYKLTQTPEHLLNAKLAWNTTDRLTLWLKSEYRGERARFSDKYANLSAQNKALYDAVGDIEAYSVFHLGGSYKATQNLTLNASISNLLDTDFLEGDTYVYNGQTYWASSYTQSAAGTSGVLEEGRRLWLSATVDF